MTPLAIPDPRPLREPPACVTVDDGSVAAWFPEEVTCTCGMRAYVLFLKDGLARCSSCAARAA